MLLSLTSCQWSDRTDGWLKRAPGWVRFHQRGKMNACGVAHATLDRKRKKKTNVKMQGLKVTVQSFICLSKLFYEGKMTPDMFLALFRSHDPNTSSWYLWTEENHDNWSLSTTIQDLFMACWLHTMTWICWETGVEIQLCHRRNKYIKINLLFLIAIILQIQHLGFLAIIFWLPTQECKLFEGFAKRLRLTFAFYLIHIVRPNVFPRRHRYGFKWILNK